MKFLVQCTLELEVDMEGYENPEFVIEENSCPATGPVWAALSEIIEQHDAAGTCWACSLNGENKIIRRID